MKFRLFLIAALIALTFTALFIHYSISQVPKPWRGFTFSNIPQEIESYPGENITIEGGAINIGWYWLGDFHLTVSGLPEGYNYSITPSYFENLRILREWNPQQGVYRIPQNFTLLIKIPENGFGVHLVNITGQEFRSWYKFSNSTQFILKVISLPNFTITDIVIPETITQYQPFNLTFTAKNEGVGTGSLNITIDTPEDWDVSERTKTIVLDVGASQPVEIVITPTNTSGNINILAEYPYKETIVNITQLGPFLTPMPVELPPVELPGPTGFAAVVEFFRSLGPIVFGVGIILLIIIIWNVWGIYKGYKKKKEPEEMKEKKKQAEPSNSIPEL